MIAPEHRGIGAGRQAEFLERSSVQEQLVVRNAVVGRAESDTQSAQSKASQRDQGSDLMQETTSFMRFAVARSRLTSWRRCRSARNLDPRTPYRRCKATGLRMRRRLRVVKPRRNMSSRASNRVNLAIRPFHIRTGTYDMGCTAARAGNNHCSGCK